MKVFLFQSGYKTKIPLKKTLSLLTIVLCIFQISAQVMVRIEPGVLLETDSDNLGLLLNIEPKVKNSQNTVIGLRFGLAINPQKIDIDDNTSFFIDDLDDNGVISFVPTFDYYLNEKRYRPYIGAGIGYYLFNTIDISNRNGTSNIIEGSVKNQLGFLVRGGLELGGYTRIGVEYNFIPKADIEIPNGQVIGTVDNSYLGLSLGFIIVGRKRLKEL